MKRWTCLTVLLLLSNWVGWSSAQQIAYPLRGAPLPTSDGEAATRPPKPDAQARDTLVRPMLVYPHQVAGCVLDEQPSASVPLAFLPPGGVAVSASRPALPSPRVAEPAQPAPLAQASLPPSPISYQIVYPFSSPPLTFPSTTPTVEAAADNPPAGTSSDKSMSGSIPLYPVPGAEPNARGSAPTGTATAIPHQTQPGQPARPVSQFAADRVEPSRAGPGWGEPAIPQRHSQPAALVPPVNPSLIPPPPPFPSAGPNTYGVPPWKAN